MPQQEDLEGNERVTAPSHLNAAAKRFFRKMITAHPYLKSTGMLEQLIAACDARERYMEARKILKKKGLVMQDRFGVDKCRPEVEIERAALNMFSRLMARLGFEKSEDKDLRKNDSSETEIGLFR